MVLILLAILFAYMAIKELAAPSLGERDNFSKGYILVCAAIAMLCAKPAYEIWRLETFLSSVASEVANVPNAKVKCNSIISSALSGKGIKPLAGTAYIETGEIFFENNWCRTFIRYLKDPAGASNDEVFSMHVFTHEVMHIRGERNEKKTDCQAVQRNHQVGVLLGVNAEVAKRNALLYYDSLYPKHNYFSEKCRPDGNYDEKLTNSIWQN